MDTATLDGMAFEPGALDLAALVRSTSIFRDLSSEQLAAIWSQAKVLRLLRGEVLVRQNTSSDVVYIVVSGRFEIWLEGQDRPINEVGVGEPIGEIGFCAMPRSVPVYWPKIG